jgi:hypothetical protein
LCLSPNIIRTIKSRRDEKGLALAPREASRNIHKILKFWSEKCRERNHLGDLDIKYECNIKTDLKATGCEGMGWISLGQNANLWRIFVITVMNLQVP